MVDALPGDEPERARGWRWLVALLGVAITFFALAHSLEDFAYGVPEERFGIDPTPAAILLAGAFIVQALALLAAWRGTTLGYAASFGVGVAWFVAAVLDHTGDLLDESFREHAVSDTLIAGLMLSSLLLALASGAALWLRLR